MMINPLISELIFDSEFTSTDDIRRFNGLPTIKGESVSQHTYWVTTFTRILSEAIILPKYRDNIDMVKFVLNCVTKANFHDHEETITGDVIFNFKHNAFNGEQIVKLINEYVEHSLEKQIANKENIVNKTVCDSLFDINELEKAVIKVADWLACLKYEYQELQLGNKNFIPVLTKSLKHYKKALENLDKLALEHLGEKYNYKVVIYQLDLKFEQFQ